MNKIAPVYIIEAKRTAIGKLYGSLSAIRPDDLISGLIADVLVNNPIIPKDKLDALILGCGNQAGEDNRNIARMAILLNNLPKSAFASTVNSLCTSGMDAFMQAARLIMCGEADFCLAGGVESMSRAPWIESRTVPERVDSTLGWRFVNPKIRNSVPTHSMPETAEYLSKLKRISREEQDDYAIFSRERYERALNKGFYDNEIIPVGQFKYDEQHRTLSKKMMTQLPTLVKGGEFVTLGNSARIGDGAAVLILVSEKFLKDNNLEPKVKILSMAVAAEHPDLMAVAGLTALEKALKKSGIKKDDIGQFELSEAFAVQILAMQQMAGFDLSLVNPFGGTISMGNPLGMGAARLLVTLVNAMSQNKNIKYGAAASGAGLGVGTAVVLENYSSF